MDTQQETCIVERAWKAFENCFSTYAPHSREVLRRAFDFAHDKHRGQTRKSGEPYILHPLAVAHILAELHMDEVSLISALLHDVVEDTSVSLEEISKEFSEEVAGIVDGLTKLEKVKFRSSQEKLAENFRKMVLAMSKDIRVIIVKVADRTHNMRTIKGHKLEKQQKISQETLEIYAPLAGRLGIYRLKAELEDLCLKALKPSVYFSLTTRIDQKKTEREAVIQEFCDGLKNRLEHIHIPADVIGRVKHFFSIYKKMSEKQIDFEDIYDLFAVRVMVDTISQCYEVLGVVHSHFKPVPGRFKDYIAMPKPNLYQSLHTTVVNENGELLEVQIRTKRMHDIAENGIAAHWAYKEARKEEGLSTKTQDFQKFNWLKQIVNHQKELNDPDEFLEAVKVDLFDDEVYVFTPRGDVLELRRGATALDYAFSVHTDLGLKTQGAKINGRIVPIRTLLRSRRHMGRIHWTHM